jgi:signal transduction histidine kinase
MGMEMHEREDMVQVIAMIKSFIQHHLIRRWLIIGLGLALQAGAIILVMAVLRSSTVPQPQDDLLDHLLTSMLAGIFSVTGVMLFLRSEERATASIVYGVFVCASLIFILLNVGAYKASSGAVIYWIATLIIGLSMIAHGLATTCVCLLFFPSKTSQDKLYISPYTPSIFSLVLSVISLPVLNIFPHWWIFSAFFTYGFPLICMVTVTWGMLVGVRRRIVRNQQVAGMTAVGMVFVLLSLAIIDGKSTLSQILIVPSAVSFLIFYTLFGIVCALLAGVLVWSIRWLAARALHIRILMAIAGTALTLFLGIRLIPDTILALIGPGITALFTAHLFTFPLMILPLICCYVLIHYQLSGSGSVLSRQLIRGTLWFTLASAFVISEILISVLEMRIWFDRSEMALIYTGWLLLCLWLFPFVWSKVRAMGDRIFYRDFYHYNRTLQDLSMALTRLRSLDEICSFILPRLSTLLNASAVALLVRKEQPQMVGQEQWQSYYYATEASDISEEHFRGAVEQVITSFSEHSDEPVYRGGILLLPLYDGTTLQGCLCLGPKANSEPYSRQDRSFLATLVAQLAVLEANTRYLEQVRTNATQLAALNHRIVSAQEEERRHLALELHDEVLQQSMLLVRQLADAGTMSEVAATMPLARSVVKSLRTTCLELRPPLLDELGLPEALHWLTQQTAQRGHIQIDLQLDLQGINITGKRAPNEVELVLYRVAQEALTNVLKHTRASRVKLRLRYSRLGTITLVVADNGCGLQHVPPSESLGLAGMKERMQAIAGSFRLRSSYGRGVVIRATYRPPAISQILNERPSGHEAITRVTA